MNAFLGLHRLSTRLDPGIADYGGALASLAIRLYVGWQFFKSGMVKLQDWGATLALFQDEYQVPLLPPDVAAVMGTAGELVFPALLFIGLFSRPAALGLFLMNAMAVISYPALFEFECPAALNDHFYWGFLLLALLAYGPGRLSADAWLGSKTGK